MTLRARLLLAFTLTAAAPVVVLLPLLLEGARRASSAAIETRLDGALRATAARLEALERRAAAALRRIADEGAATELAPEVTVASLLARRHGLSALALLDDDGRVLSSAHWAAGHGLQDADRLVSAADALFAVRVAAGHGFEERLAVLAESRAAWSARRVTLRGGGVLDDPLLTELSDVAGAEVGLFDSNSGRVHTRRGSPIEGWRPESSGASEGVATWSGQAHAWRARQLGAAAALVVALPAAETSSVLEQARRRTWAIAAGTLLGAIALATLVSASLVRRLEALRAQTERIAAGEHRALAAASGGDEIAELGRAMNAIAVDLRSSEARLIQASRVAAWRDVAQRLAHELKNPLFPIQLSVETLRRAFDRRAQSPPALSEEEFGKLFVELSDTILRELKSLKSIVEEFSRFARMPRPQLRAVAVGAVVDRVLDLHRARLGGVRVRREVDQDIPPVSADPDLLAQALSNLVANALDAMRDAGTLTIAIRRQPAAVEIAVGDDGPGLSESARANLFQPYHTTKPGGTGLGLVIVQSIVSDHRGTLAVESAPGRGATFTVRLPV